MLQEPNRFRIFVYFTALLAMYVMMSNSDYTEARKLECANRSNRHYQVEWDSKSDVCKKEPRNGTTSQNR